MKIKIDYKDTANFSTILLFWSFIPVVSVGWKFSFNPISDHSPATTTRWLKSKKFLYHKIMSHRMFHVSDLIFVQIKKLFFAEKDPWQMLSFYCDDDTLAKNFWHTRIESIEPNKSK